MLHIEWEAAKSPHIENIRLKFLDLRRFFHIKSVLFCLQASILLWLEICGQHMFSGMQTWHQFQIILNGTLLEDPLSCAFNLTTSVAYTFQNTFNSLLWCKHHLQDPVLRCVVFSTIAWLCEKMRGLKNTEV